MPTIGNQFWRLRDPDHPNLRRTQFKKDRYYGPGRRTAFSRGDIVNLYHNHGLTQKQVAEELGVCEDTIRQYMKKWGIQTIYNHGRKITEETKRRISEAKTGKYGGKNNPFYGKHHTKETLKRIIKSRNRKPNNAEILLDSIIHRVTDSFQYNGDLRLGISIGGKVPDWVNVNGEKQVIELLGHGWHIPNKWFRVPESKTLNNIIAHYKSHGWKCLAIYDYELKDEREIAGKLDTFIGGGDFA